MEHNQFVAVDELDNLDEDMKNLYTLLQITALGMDAECMENGEVFASALRHIMSAIDDMRAKLDMATCAVALIKTVA